MKRLFVVFFIIFIVLFLLVKLNTIKNKGLSPAYIPVNSKELFVQTKLEYMTLEEKVGQMFILGINEPALSSKSAELIIKTNAGGVIIMGGHTLSEINNLTREIKDLNQKIPLFIAVDREVLMSDNFCQNVQEISISLKENGVNLNFGIIGDIGWYPDSFIKPRTYADNPEDVSKRVNETINCSEGVFTTVKHFPGHGRTRLNSHFTVPEIDITYDDWLKTDALPFKTAINNNIDFIMFGHLIYKNIDSQPASLSKKFHQILRNDFKFKGLTITDDLGMLEISDYQTEEVLKQAIEADNNILLYVNSNKEFSYIYQSAVKIVKNNRLLEERINTNIKRILELKYKQKLR